MNDSSQPLTQCRPYVQVHEADVGVVLLPVGHEGDEGLGNSMTHPPTQTVHMEFVEANRFQEWRLRPEEFIHNVLEGRKLTSWDRYGMQGDATGRGKSCSSSTNN